MQHVLKIKNLSRLGAAEAIAAVCDAAEKLKTAARSYAIAKAVEAGAMSHASPKARAFAVDFNDESPEGKALEEAARTYVLWRDALVHVSRREKRKAKNR